MSTRQAELRSVAEFINGAAFKPEDWGEEGKRIIRIQNLTDSSKPYNRTKREISQKQHINPGDLLVSWSASLGVYEWGGPDVGLLNQHIFRVIPDENRVNKRYLRFGLEQALKEMERHLHGATMKHVNRGEFLSTKLYLPSLQEQRRIAEILDKADALRAKRRAALAQLDTLTQSIFLDMFGDPISNPRRWPQQDLKTFFNFRTGKLDSNAAVPGGQYPFFTCSQDDLQIDTFAFNCEALLLAGNNANADYSVKHYKGKFNAYQRTYVITLQDERNSYDYAQFMLAHRLGHLKRISKGTNTKYLTLELLNRIQVPVPPVKMQEKYAQQVALVNRYKMSCSAWLAEIDALFASLQHRAFRGEL